jgi:hypothetical protein
MSIRHLAARKALAFGEIHELSAKMVTTIPPQQIDRMLPGKEAAHMIVRLVEGRGREMTSRFPRPEHPGGSNQGKDG